MEVSIEKKDITTIIELIEGYKNCHNEIKKLESEMERLQSEMNNSLNELNKLREKESLLHQDFSTRYGNGFLDTQKIKWIKTEDENSN
jgi:uncharacterized coiled-coil DUF342 family protein